MVNTVCEKFRFPFLSPRGHYEFRDVDGIVW